MEDNGRAIKLGYVWQCDFLNLGVCNNREGQACESTWKQRMKILTPRQSVNSGQRRAASTGIV